MGSGKPAFGYGGREGSREGEGIGSGGAEEEEG